MAALKCLACCGVIEAGEPMVMVITVLPSRLTGVPLQQHVDTAPGRWHWRCAPRAIRRYASPIMPVDDAGFDDQ
jgi:hypothetical protein